MLSIEMAYYLIIGIGSGSLINLIHLHTLDEYVENWKKSLYLLCVRVLLNNTSHATWKVSLSTWCQNLISRIENVSFIAGTMADGIEFSVIRGYVDFGR